jgi:hypothetical protein
VNLRGAPQRHPKPDPLVHRPRELVNSHDLPEVVSSEACLPDLELNVELAALDFRPEGVDHPETEAQRDRIGILKAETLTAVRGVEPLDTQRRAMDY